MNAIRPHSAISRERRRTYEAAALHGIRPLALVQFAEQRAGIEIVRDLDRRDFVQEVREELADGRNYWAWLREQLDRGAHLNLPIVNALRAECRAGLGATALAFEHAERTRSLMTEWRPLDIAA